MPVPPCFLFFLFLHLYDKLKKALLSEAASFNSKPILSKKGGRNECCP